jgi:hypothetical protein
MIDHQYARATVRNRDFILDVLHDASPTTGTILEVASDSGEHVVHFARNLPSLVFQPSDPEPDDLLSVVAWAKAKMLGHEVAVIGRIGHRLQVDDRRATVRDLQSRQLSRER